MGSLNEKLLEDHLQSLPDLPRYYFDYVVPADVYSNFKPVPLKCDATDHPRVARTHVQAPCKLPASSLQAPCKLPASSHQHWSG